MLCLFHEKHIYAFNSTHGRTAINKKAAKLLSIQSHTIHIYFVSMEPQQTTTRQKSSRLEQQKHTHTQRTAHAHTPQTGQFGG